MGGGPERAAPALRSRNRLGRLRVVCYSGGMNARSRVRCLLTCVLVLATAAAHAQALLSPPGPAPDEDPVAVSTAW